MKSIFTLLSACVVRGQVDLRIPLDVDHRTGRLYVNVTMLPSGARPMPLEISLFRNSRAVYEGTYVDGETRMRIDGNPSFELTEGGLVLGSLHDDPNEQSHLAINSLSTFVQAVGAVAIIRRNNPPSAELVIGSSSLAFNQTCFSTGFQIEQVSHAHFARSLEPVSARVGVAGTSANDSLGGSLGVIHFRRNTQLVVFPAVYWHVVDSIVESGMVELGNNNFGNCTVENMIYLPSIEVVFDDSEGTLVLFPEDYLDVTTTPGSCQLQMRPTSPYESPISSIGLLKLSNLNVRISSDRQIQICDAM
jgi:hypothetical protein